MSSTASCRTSWRWRRRRRSSVAVDTDFQSSRVNVISMFPLSGQLPDVRDWREFEAYFARMRRTGLVESMKDFYWDVRRNPSSARSNSGPSTCRCRYACRRPRGALPGNRALLPGPGRDSTPRCSTTSTPSIASRRRSPLRRVILDTEFDRPGTFRRERPSLIERCLPYCADHERAGGSNGCADRGRPHRRRLDAQRHGPTASGAPADGAVGAAVQPAGRRLTSRSYSCQKPGQHDPHEYRQRQARAHEIVEPVTAADMTSRLVW